MDESILAEIKKVLGITEEYKVFDDDLIMHINSVFMVLQQLGVGPADGFQITGYSETWADFMSESDENLIGVKSYIAMKVRLIFDPPSSSFVLDSYKKLIDEFEWRLNVQVDPGFSEVD